MVGRRDRGHRDEGVVRHGSCRAHILFPYPVTVVVPFSELVRRRELVRSSPTTTKRVVRFKSGTPGKLSNPFGYFAKLGANGSRLVTLLEAHVPHLEHNLGKR